MKRFPGTSILIDEYNDLCAKGVGLDKHNGLTLHHILPRCMFPEDEKDPENFTWLSFEDHWLAHYLLWKATSLPVYASAFWFICVYGMKNRGMTISAEDYEQLKQDIKQHYSERRQQDAANISARLAKRSKEARHSVDSKSRSRSKKMH